MKVTKRGFLKSAAVGVAGGLLTSCGGGGGGAGESGAGGAMPSPVLVQDLQSLEPLPSAFDLAVNPFSRVSGDLPLRVIQDGLPLAGVPVQGFGAGGELIFSGVTDAEGGLVWHGERSLAVRLVAQGPEGELSIYDVEDPADSLAPLVLNVLTTLADRVRLARRWLPSQADVRVHQFCGIGMHTPLNQTFIDHPEFDHARFAQLREASGLSQDQFLQQLVQRATADDFQAQAVRFAPLNKSALKLGPMDIISPVFFNSMKALDMYLSDEQKMALFGGLLVDLDLLHPTDPVLLALDAIGRQLDDIQISLNKLLEELRKVRQLVLGKEINELDQALTLVRKVMLGTTTGNAKRADICKLLDAHNIVGGNLPFLAVQAFLGGLAESPYDPDKGVYPLLFLQNNNIDFRTGGFEQGVRAEDLQRFFGRERQAIYEQALDNVIVLYGMGMAWAMMYQTLVIAQQTPGTQAHADEMSRLTSLARETTTFGNLFTALRPTRIPHDDVFFNLDDDTAWFVPKSWVLERHEFYGGWHQEALWRSGGRHTPWTLHWASQVRGAHTLLPSEVKAMVSQPWGPPSKAMLENAFFKHAGKQSVHDYAIAKGASSNGAYVVNVKGKPELSVWLSDLSFYSVVGGDAANPYVFTYRRGYARLHSKSMHAIGNMCSLSDLWDDLLSVPGYCENYREEVPYDSWHLRALGNYDQSTHYFYPSSSHVIEPRQYYPWHSFKQVLEETNGLRLAMVFERYAPN